MRHRAFTLVELLVVIAVTGILVALLIPAVQSAREAARSVQCKNNLKQAALAVLNYESANGILPPMWLPKNELTWRYSILPFMEESGIYDQIQNPDEWDIVYKSGLAVDPGRPGYVAGYQCPTTPGVPLLVRTHIVGTGKDQSEEIFDALGQSHYDAPLHLEYRPCAWFGPTHQETVKSAEGSNIPDYRANPAKLRRITDGLSKTILLSENADLKPEWQNGKMTAVANWSTFLAHNVRTEAKINVYHWGGLFSFHSAKGARRDLS